MLSFSSGFLLCATIECLSAAHRLRVNNPPRHAIEGMSDNNLHTTAVEMECQGFVNGYPPGNFVPGKSFVNGVRTGPSPGLANVINSVRREKLKIEHKSRPPVDTKKPALSRRYLHPPQVNRSRCVDPFPVENRVTFPKTLEREAEMQPSRPKRKDRASPPVVLGEIDITLFRPPLQPLDQGCLATAGWTRDYELAKLHTTGIGDTFDPGYIFNRDTVQMHRESPRASPGDVVRKISSRP